MEANQWKQKKQHDIKSRDRSFKEGDTVFIRNFQAGDKWVPGVISKKTGPVSFVVQLSDGRERRCHQDQLRFRTVDVTVEELIETETPSPHSEDIELPSPSDTNVPSSSDQVSPTPSEPPPRKTYPTRVRTTVQRYEPRW